MSTAIRLATPEDAAAIVALYAPYVQKHERHLRIRGALRRGITAPASRRSRAFSPSTSWRRTACPRAMRTRTSSTRARRINGCARPRSTWARASTARATPRAFTSGFCARCAPRASARPSRSWAARTCPRKKLHESLGFSRIGTFAKAGYKLGQWHDVKWYGLELRPREDAPADPIPFLRAAPGGLSRGPKKWKRCLGFPDCRALRCAY